MNIKNNIFVLISSFWISLITLGQMIDNYTSSTSWVVPTGVTSIQIDAWGGGGGGGGARAGCASNCTQTATGGGGKGGMFSSLTVSVVAGDVITITVGSGGAAGAGSTSSASAGGTGGTTSVMVNSIVVVSAIGGNGGGGANGSGNGSGATGYLSAGIGSLIFNGGNGATGAKTTSRQTGGSGGGGAGSTANGTDGMNPTSGSGGPSGPGTAGNGGAADGGNGGLGGTGTATGQSAGSNGSDYGGAGGGARAYTTTSYKGAPGGAGAQGKVKISYTAVSCTQAPPTPSVILGETSPCAGTTQIYSVVNDPEATSYSWTLPSGFSGTSTSNSISVVSGTNTGQISVIATNNCGSSSSQTLNLTPNDVLTQPVEIQGNLTVCENSSETYSVTNDPNASSYTWTLPADWTGTSSVNSISTSSGINGGVISVVANNVCGSSDAQTLTLSVISTPSQPNVISGNTTLCQNSTATYSVLNDFTATSYTWTLPVNWTGTSTSNSISATSSTTGGEITVIATNACGSSIAQTQTIGIISIPNQPDVISGNGNVCENSSEIYSVTNDPTANSYVWTFPVNWTGSSSTNSISVMSGTNGGIITVLALNACGSSSAQSLTVTSGTIPDQPSSIVGNSVVCENSSETYSVTNDPNVTSYTWILPVNWTGTSTSNTISATSTSTGGVITITANNTCGSSIVQTLPVVVNQASSATITHAECGTSYSLNGQSYTASGTYTQTISNVAGCDSIITLELILTSPFTATISQSGNDLLASELGADSYQWLSCPSNTVVSGANGQTFTPSVAGNYTVNITKGACTSTSSCFAFNLTNSLEVNELDHSILVFPNPSSGLFTISSELEGEVIVELFTLSGQKIEEKKTAFESQIMLDLNNHADGIYFLKITQEKKTTQIRLIKE